MKSKANLGLWLVLVAVAVASGSALRADEPPSSKWVGLDAGGMSASADGLALSLSVANKKKETLWVRVAFQAPADGSSCEDTVRLEAKGKHRFSCPQSVVVAEADYPVTISIFTVEGQETPVEKLDTRFRFSAQNKEAFERLRQRLASMKENAPLEPFAPVTFETVWYRGEKKGLIGRAYQATGTLTVGPEALTFASDKKTLAIPLGQVESVDLDSMSHDLANKWVVVRFRLEGQDGDVAGFRDGKGLGNGPRTPDIYDAVRKATAK